VSDIFSGIVSAIRPLPLQSCGTSATCLGEYGDPGVDRDGLVLGY